MNARLAAPTNAAPLREEVTLLFSDVVGSTALTLSLGDFEAHRLMQRHHAIVRETLAAFGGSEVEVQGDGFLLAFPTVRQGVDCAIAIQRALEPYRDESSVALRVRIGVHAGAAIAVEGRYFGADVILCARICDAAGADEILVSKSAAAALPDATRLGMPRLERMKGFDGAQAVTPVRWESRLGNPPESRESNEARRSGA